MSRSIWSWGLPTQSSEAEVFQRFDQPAGVGRFGFDPEIQVLGEAGLAVERDRVGADDERPNSPGVAAREQIFEVLRYAHR